MWFLLRAVLVIGFVSVLALEKRGMLDRPLSLPVALPARVALPDGINPDLLRGGADLTGLLAALPPETRTRVIKAGTEEIARRLGAAPAVPSQPAATPSQDALAPADRRTPWRGAQAR